MSMSLLVGGVRACMYVCVGLNIVFEFDVRPAGANGIGARVLVLMHEVPRVLRSFRFVNRNTQGWSHLEQLLQNRLSFI